MAIDAETTTITIRTTTALAIDNLIESGDFADRDEAVIAAVVELQAVRARRNRYDKLLQESFDDVAAGRVFDATPEFFERSRIEARERARARKLTGGRFIPDPDVFGPADDR